MITANRQHGDTLRCSPCTWVGIIVAVGEGWGVVNISAVENGVDFTARPVRQLFVVGVGADAQHDCRENRHAAILAAAADSYCPQGGNMSLAGYQPMPSIRSVDVNVHQFVRFEQQLDPGPDAGKQRMKLTGAKITEPQVHHARRRSLRDYPV